MPPPTPARWPHPAAPRRHAPPKVWLDFAQAADYLTEMMIKLGKVDRRSVVLDLGCGPGLATRQIAARTGAACVGLDLTPENVARATEAASAAAGCRYFEGSFTSFPPGVAAAGRPYTHIWSQVALCHAHAELDTIFEEAKTVLVPGGKFVLTDYLGADGPYTSASGAHFPHLHGHVAWREVADKAGLVLEHYQNLDRHMAQGYRDLAAAAEHHGFRSKDGSRPMAEDYHNAVALIEAGRMGMNLVVLALPPTLALPQPPPARL